jgi:hypothetical protein
MVRSIALGVIATILWSAAIYAALIMDNGGMALVLASSPTT